MKTYPLYLTEPQLRLVLDLLSSVVDDVSEQITMALNAIQADHANEPSPRELFARGASLAAAVTETRSKRKAPPVRRVEAIEALGVSHPEAAKALAAWKNKADGVLGWDRWVRANFPAAAAALWPSEAAAKRSVKRANA
jgi:hypothetical protein